MTAQKLKTINSPSPQPTALHRATKWRILQVASGLRCFSGTERHVLDLSTALSSRGHIVRLVCPGDCVLADMASERGLNTLSIDMRSTYQWSQLPKYIRAVAGQYDIVHVHSPLDYVVPAVAARMRRVQGIVMTRHMPQPFRSRTKVFICQSLLYDRIITASSFIRAMLIESGARAEQIEVVPYGLPAMAPDPLSAARLRDELNIPRSAILIAAAGRISPDKGFDVLLKAVSELTHKGITLYCVIFGSGTMLEELRRLAERLRIGAIVRLPGFRRDVNLLWSAADIAVIPSVWQEPFGYVALEALMAGCAVIASRVGGLPEVVSPESAILTEPGDARGIAAAIEFLISSPERRRALQAAAVRRAEMFSLHANVAGVERVYEGVLRRPQTGRACANQPF